MDNKEIARSLYRLAGQAEADDPMAATRYHNAANTIRAVQRMGGFSRYEFLIGLCKVMAEEMMEYEEARNG